MTNKQITAKIRQIREQSGVCQEAVASAIDITVQSYSKIERGETQLSVERLYQISDFFKISVEEILGCEPRQVFNNSPYQQGGSYVAFNNTEIEHVKNLYERLLDEKEKTISLLKSQLNK